MISNAQWTIRGRMRSREAVVVSSGPSDLLVDNGVSIDGVSIETPFSSIGQIDLTRGGLSDLLFGVSMLVFFLPGPKKPPSAYHSSSTPKPPLRVKIAVGTMSRRRASICREIDKPRRILFFTESPLLFSMLIADIMEIMIEL